MTDHDPLFAPLNEPQALAVRETTGPTWILAGAGSGKTRALTHRIAYLMQQGIPPWQILAVTFTNKAATEMKERIKGLLHVTDGDDLSPWSFGSGKLPVMGTFHSICAKILRRDIEKIGRDRRFVIYDTDDQQRLMKGVLRDLSIDEKDLKPKAALGYIGRFKCEAVNPKEAAEQATTARMDQAVRAYQRYQDALKEANAMDFDDLILETVRLFHEAPDVLDRYQETWRYLHVDEYQDTNHAQYLFITLLAQKYRNLCVIGDPDQSIYAFRGADIRNILEFEKDYPDAREIKLEQNYRSTQIILDAADSVIASNPNRPGKKMWTEQKEGPKVTVQEVADEKCEADEAIKAAKQKEADNSITLNDQVILYRTNAQSRVFEEACMRSGIPYRIIGGVKFYARREVKDVLAYLYVTLNPNDTVSLLRIINVPSRKIGATTMGKIQAYSSEHGLTLWDALNKVHYIDDINDPTKKRIGDFVALIGKFQAHAQQMPVAQLALDIIEETGLEKWMRDDTEEGETRWQNVQELLTVMHKYDQLDPETSLTSFLEEVALVSEVDKLTEASDNALTLMTLHLCKGLEFEHVMIVGCEEGIFPHANSLFDKNQLEEETRLMYVGMTRAKRDLTLLHARSRMQWGNQQANAPSRYLDDLPESCIERRSDELLSAFAWASASGQQKAWTKHPSVEPFRQHNDVDLDLNQDTEFEDVNQTPMEVGTRVKHPTFGEGTVVNLRGDLAEVQFDSGEEKTFALSIAPLQVL